MAFSPQTNRKFAQISVAMLKIILKNLWMRRSQNAWLFAELIIVSILTWVIIDPSIVSLYGVMRPAGYDIDRIVNVSIRSYTPGTKKYDSLADTPERLASDYDAILTKAASLPDVELCDMIVQPLNSTGTSYMSNKIGVEAIDTVVKGQLPFWMTEGNRFFSVYGIKAADGSPSVAEIEAEGISDNECVITETVDRAYWPDQRGLRGKRFIAGTNETGDTLYKSVKAIVSDFRPNTYLRSDAAVFMRHNIPAGSTMKNFTIVLRLRDGIDAASYAADNLKLIFATLRTGNFHVAAVTDQQSDIENIQNITGLRADRLFNISLAAFFLLSLILGVTGCVWLQTGKRVQEIGVLRSFGARRSDIVRMLIGESVILATAAFIIGDMIYCQFALNEGLDKGHYQNDMFITSPNWVDSFPAHFAVVSVIILVIIIFCAVIGTYFPARHVSRIEPVDALRDE